ncbi:MAG TPA: 4'-phosphopantetheinyl transferase superfamily protein [Bryobacteraceae bacterium]|jgi:4'-phosphopantetheinyl transferase|nr:4'-phosphopantetheinyl transferase superfamily protein [Bryobacteraceae bacterium]
MTIELKSDHLHIWYANIGPQQPSPDSLEKILTHDERDRAARFHFNIHRVRYVYTHACLRLLLGSYLQVAPETICFRFGPFGKPYIAAEDNQLISPDRKLVEFNISHSADLALLGFSLGAAIGIDTEFINRQLKIHEVAPVVFTPGELAYMYSASPAVQFDRFFDLWSRKEAYAKALGMGLQIPFKELDIGQQSIVNGLRIYSFEPVPGYIAAVVAPPSVHSIQYFEFKHSFWPG